MVAALQACTDVVPTTVGKPETPGLATILKRTDLPAEDVVMVGDRPDTDVLCANRLGVPTVLVMTGVTTPEKAEALYAADPRPLTARRRGYGVR
jgi:ribonucleotide monophosphatase NagD (HAD superfamily)